MSKIGDRQLKVLERCDAANKSKPAQGHTPGPWHSQWNESDVEHHVLGPKKADGFSEIVAQVLRTDNALLIVAAPDLLAALERTLDVITGDQAAELGIYAAIAKAEGRAQ